MRFRNSIIVASIAVLCAIHAMPARAETDPLFDLLDYHGSAGLGLAVRVSTSPYAGGGQTVDLLPLYLYEGELFYLHSYRAGLKFGKGEPSQFEFFLAHHFEGFPYDRTPQSLAGMERRNPGLDAGLGYRLSGTWGEIAAELRRDVSDESEGTEFRVGYGYETRSGPLSLHPYVSMSVRDSNLNNYYYGVREPEATAERPAYIAGAGFNFQFGLYARYELTEHWRLLAGAGVERYSSEIRESPIVDKSWQVSGYLGAAYDFTGSRFPWAERDPIRVKVFYGHSTDCNFLPIVTSRCASTSTVDDTRIYGVHLGRLFMEDVMDWPLDFVGYVGVLRHDERGLAPNSWQIDAYMKAVWRGFPWSEYVRTRIGFGIGLSYATRVPYVEAVSQAERGRETSKLLNYLDPSIDINMGDVFRAKSLRETWFGIGVSHRSGVFGSSELLGNTDGGSNYLYTYIETSF